MSANLPEHSLAMLGCLKDFVAARYTATLPEGGVSNRPAGGIIIARTTSGAHFLRTYMPVCMVPKCGDAGTVELVSRFAKDPLLLCLDHGIARLEALDYGKRVAS